jgi:hypothetical protein
VAVEEPSIYARPFLYARVLLRHGWKTIVFWIATIYSIYATLVPSEDQEAVLKRIHVDPKYRLAIWGFGLALFFLYVGFRAWNEADSAGPQGELARVQTALAREQLQTLREQRRDARESKIKREFRRLSSPFGDMRPGVSDDDDDQT